MIHNLFPTAIGSFSIDKQAKEKHLEYLYELQGKDFGVNRSNINSWHSSPQFNIIEEKPFEYLKKFIFDSVKATVNEMGYDKIVLKQTESWCIISPTGSYNKLHNHPMAFISGSYYVSNPDSPITFYDPRPIKSFTEPKGSNKITIYNSLSVSFKPKEGDLLIFPSWLDHSVPENKSLEDRVIISFNFCLA